jgi:hypothetical protein
MTISKILGWTVSIFEPLSVMLPTTPICTWSNYESIIIADHCLTKETKLITRKEYITSFRNIFYILYYLSKNIFSIFDISISEYLVRLDFIQSLLLLLCVFYSWLHLCKSGLVFIIHSL